MMSLKEVLMRRVRYAVAASLDGYIAGPNGESDWIIMDPEIDFKTLFNQFDTALLGRRTFQAMASTGNFRMPGMKTFVFSRTLQSQDHPKVTIVADKPEEAVAALRANRGKDIWLFGGGSLFRSLAEAGLVDTVEVSVVPVLLGGGIPLLPSPANQIKLSLTGHKVYKTGAVSLEYAIKRTNSR
jgi:dihydrofolate reductase